MDVQPLKHPRYHKLGTIGAGMLVEVFNEHIVSEGFFITTKADTIGEWVGSDKRGLFDPTMGIMVTRPQSTRVVPYPGACIVKDYIEGATMPCRGREHG